MRTNRGYTLIELLVATASASVLMVGLSSALFVSARALDMDEGATIVRNEADKAISRMTDELKEARRFLAVEPTSVHFTVPDRDNDGREETLLFTWSGTVGDPLLRQVNDGGRVALISNVRSVNFAALTRSVTAQDVTIDPNPPWPVVESIASAVADPTDADITVAQPAGLQVDELLLAFVATDGNTKDALSPPPGWSEIDLNENGGQVTFGVWWRLATNSEPAAYSWGCSSAEHAAAVVARISNQYPGNPVTSYATDGNQSSTPDAPATGTTLANSMVLRVCGFDGGAPQDPGATGVTEHTDAYMGGVAGEVGVGVCYRIQATPSDTGHAAFSLSTNEEWRALTIVIAPKE